MGMMFSAALGWKRLMAYQYIHTTQKVYNEDGCLVFT